MRRRITEARPNDIKPGTHLAGADFAEADLAFPRGAACGLVFHLLLLTPLFHQPDASLHEHLVLAFFHPPLQQLLSIPLEVLQHNASQPFVHLGVAIVIVGLPRCHQSSGGAGHERGNRKKEKCTPAGIRWPGVCGHPAGRAAAGVSGTGSAWGEAAHAPHAPRLV